MALVSEWYTLATGAGSPPDNPHFRFLALWVAFNGLYSLKFPRAKTEVAQIRSFGSWGKAKEAHTAALSDAGYRKAIDILRQDGVFNFVTHQTEHLADEDDLVQVMRLVYRVRCNLFHGRKVPSNLRDRRLVSAAQVIVGALMSRIVPLLST